MSKIGYYRSPQVKRESRKFNSRENMTTKAMVNNELFLTNLNAVSEKKIRVERLSEILCVQKCFMKASDWHASS